MFSFSLRDGVWLASLAHPIVEQYLQRSLFCSYSVKYEIVITLQVKTITNSHVVIRYWCNPESALKVDQRVSKGLYLFACTNSCMNPVVYGAFNIRTRRRPQQVRQRSDSTATALTCTTDIRLPALSISVRKMAWPTAGVRVDLDPSRSTAYSSLHTYHCRCDSLTVV